MAETSSVRPAPTSPAMPRISPRRRSKEMSLTTLRSGLVASQQVTLRTSITTSPMSCGSRGKRFFISRPTIMVMMSPVDRSAMGRVAI